MKKMIAVLTSVLMIVSLAACRKKEEKQSLPEESVVSGGKGWGTAGKYRICCKNSAENSGR